MFSRTINARGDLAITADAEGREEVTSWERDGYGRNRPLAEVESRLFEALGLEQIGPEEVGGSAACLSWRGTVGRRVRQLAGWGVLMMGFGDPVIGRGVAARDHFASPRRAGQVAAAK